MTFYAVLLNNESKTSCSSTSPKTSAIYFLSNTATYQWIIWFISGWWPIMLINTTVLLLRPTVPCFLLFSYLSHQREFKCLTQLFLIPASPKSNGSWFIWPPFPALQLFLACASPAGKDRSSVGVLQQFLLLLPQPAHSSWTFVAFSDADYLVPTCSWGCRPDLAHLVGIFSTVSRSLLIYFRENTDGWWFGHCIAYRFVVKKGILGIGCGWVHNLNKEQYWACRQ